MGVDQVGLEPLERAVQPQDLVDPAQLAHLDHGHRDASRLERLAHEVALLLVQHHDLDVEAKLGDARGIGDQQSLCATGA